jgi:hypothetical protein
MMVGSERGLRAKLGPVQPSAEVSAS